MKNTILAVLIAVCALCLIGSADNSTANSRDYDLSKYRQLMHESPICAQTVELPAADVPVESFGEPAEPELSPNRIRIFWSKDCVHCPAVKTQDVPALIAVGYSEDQFEFVEVGTDRDFAVPCYEIIANGEVRQRIEGRQTPAELSDLYNQIVVHGYPVTKDDPPTVLVEQSISADYPLRSNNWNFNGTHNVSREQAIQHLLTGSEHRNSKFTRSQLEALSMAELRALHSDDHEGRVNRQALSANYVQPTRVYRAPVQYRSSCPGGRCPR